MKRKLIVLMGLDGSGKSTQAELACEWLSARGTPAQTVWMRGESYLTKPVLRMGKAMLRAPKEKKRGGGIDAGDDYHRYVGSKQSLFKSRFLKGIWRTLTILDLYITFKVAFRKVRRETRVIVLDRYIYDSFIDIDSAFGSKGEEVDRLQRSSMLGLFPKPDLILLLDIAPGEAMKRKDDIPSMLYLEERYTLYHRLADALGAALVDAARSVDEVKAELAQHLEGVLD
jgi:thymidylate kinase